MANPELGAKQICPVCQAKFYDLGRRPAVCPKCAASFDPDEVIKTRRVRGRSAAPDYETDDETPEKKVPDEVEGFEDEPDDTPELSADAATVIEGDEEEEDGATSPASANDDLGVDFAEEEGLEEEADDVPFLEDEDEDDFPDDEIDGLPGEEDPD